MPNTTTLKGIEQGRAAYAYQCAKEGSELSEDKIRKAYKSYVKKIPMLIKTNGLGATMAFIFSKKKNKTDKSDYAYWKIYEQLDIWLRSEDHGQFSNIFNFIPLTDNNGNRIELSDAIIGLNSNQYRMVTNELIALFTWLRRYAEGLIDGDELEG
jgi:CRISPR-associated protein Cmr5